MATNEEVSFWLGMASLVFWIVAEIPQIITNYRSKSGHGLSIALLLTWVIGDIFNLVGCMLEPATLPTQFYTAMLYTVITVILVLQTIYYEYWARWRKCGHVSINPQPEIEDNRKSEDLRVPLHPSVPIPPSASSRNEIYYTSARSLANSGTPTFGSYLNSVESPPLRRSAIAAAVASISHPGRGTLISICASLPLPAKGFTGEAMAVLFSGESPRERGLQGINVGVWLGWMMTAIYMGGRIPQIILNIKRGSIEGLNPAMFLLAVLANASYVGSILASSVEWIRIRANFPWLFDAAVCVLLDLLILMQFVYYKSVQWRRRNAQDNFEVYEEIKRQMP